MSRAVIHSGCVRGGDVGAVDQRRRLWRGERLRHRMRQLGQRHGADRVVLAVAAPLEEFVEHAERRQRACKTTAPHPFAPARGEKGAHVASLEREQLGMSGRRFRWPARKARNWAISRCIGFRGVGRQLALGGEISEPSLDRLADVRRAHISNWCGPFWPTSRSPQYDPDRRMCAKRYYGYVSR